MVTKVEGFKYYLTIVGFQDAKIGNVNNLFDDIRAKSEEVIIQLFDAQCIAGKEHLLFAALNALTAFKNKTNISNNLAIEMLLYASAQRQITKAFKKIGIKPDSREIVAVVLSEKSQKIGSAIEMLAELLFGKRDDSVIELTREKFDKVKRLFEISEQELQAVLGAEGVAFQALKDLVIEHMALLVTQR